MFIQIPYPAFTICPQNRMDQSKSTLFNNIDDYIEIDIHGQVCPTTTTIYSQLFQNYQKIITYDIETMARQLKRNLSEVLLICGATDDWRNNYEPTCFEYFRESFTSNGLCFTTNGLRMSDIFRDDV